MTTRPEICSSVKQRLRRARRAAKKELKNRGFIAFELVEQTTHPAIVAIDPKTYHAKIIQIVLDSDLNAKKIKTPQVPTEIWHRRKGEKDFSIISL